MSLYIDRNLPRKATLVQFDGADLRTFKVETDTLGRSKRNRGALSGWQCRRVIEFVESNLASTIRIKDLADIVRLSESYFATAFKATFGQAPHQYVIERRMEQAKRLLLETDLPLSHVAIDCGLADQAHLCTLFRKAFGFTPKIWRKTGEQQAERATGGVSLRTR